MLCARVGGRHRRHCGDSFARRKKSRTATVFRKKNALRPCGAKGIEGAAGTVLPDEKSRARRQVLEKRTLCVRVGRRHRRHCGSALSGEKSRVWRRFLEKGTLCVRVGRKASKALRDSFVRRKEPRMATVFRKENALRPCGAEGIEGTAGTALSGEKSRARQRFLEKRTLCVRGG